MSSDQYKKELFISSKDTLGGFCCLSLYHKCMSEGNKFVPSHKLVCWVLFLLSHCTYNLFQLDPNGSIFFFSPQLINFLNNVDAFFFSFSILSSSCDSTLNRF
jgi:hypothetical protein